MTVVVSPLVDVAISYVKSDMPNLTEAEIMQIREWLNLFIMSQMSLNDITNKFNERRIPTIAVDKIDSILNLPDFPIPSPNLSSSNNINIHGGNNINSTGNTFSGQNSQSNIYSQTNIYNGSNPSNNSANPNSNDYDEGTGNAGGGSLNAGQRKKIKSWTTLEDQRLLLGIHRFGTDNWALVSEFVGNGRTRAQCSQRWLRGLDPHIVKDHWTSEDDDKLLTSVAIHGNKCWTQISEELGNRCDVQCRYRYKQLMKNPRFKHQMKEAQEKAKGVKRTVFHRKRHVRNRTAIMQSSAPAQIASHNLQQYQLHQQLQQLQALQPIAQLQHTGTLMAAAGQLQNQPQQYMTGYPNLPSFQNMPLPNGNINMATNNNNSNNINNNNANNINNTNENIVSNKSNNNNANVNNNNNNNKNGNPSMGVLAPTMNYQVMQPNYSSIPYFSPAQQPPQQTQPLIQYVVFQDPVNPAGMSTYAPPQNMNGPPQQQQQQQPPQQMQQQQQTQQQQQQQQHFPPLHVASPQFNFAQPPALSLAQQQQQQFPLGLSSNGGQILNSLNNNNKY